MMPVKTSRDDDVDERADDQRADDADRQVALRVADFLGDGRHGVEADVGEEHDRRSGLHAGPAVGRERPPVRRVRRAPADEDEEGEHDELEHDHAGVERRALADADDEHDRDQGDDAEGQDVEDDRDAEDVGRAREQAWDVRRPSGSRSPASRGC